MGCSQSAPRETTAGKGGQVILVKGKPNSLKFFAEGETINAAKYISLPGALEDYEMVEANEKKFALLKNVKFLLFKLLAKGIEKSF